MAPCNCRGLALNLSAWTVDTSMITVSSCGVKPQQVLSGLERKAEILDIHMHFCGFSFIHSLQQFLFLSTWGVIFYFIIFSAFYSIFSLIS